MYTYPYVNGAGLDVTAADVHAFLKAPTLVAKRVAELAAQRFIADFLLQGRYDATGGGVAYTIDESLYSDDDAEVIAPGGEYPLTKASEGAPEFAQVEKEGQDTLITDEAIARLLLDPVERSLTKMTNRMIKRVDSRIMSVIASEVTQTTAAGAAWTDGGQIVEDVLTADAKLDAHDLGLVGNVVVLKPLQFAKVASFFIKTDMLANGLSDAVAKGVIPSVLGKAWVTSNNVTSNDPMLVDATQLGGIGTEKIASPGYTRVPNVLGGEVKVIRDEERDQYRPRVRRIGTAVVIEPRAAIKITGTSL